MGFGVMAHENDEVGLKTKTRIYKRFQFSWNLNNCWFKFCTPTMFLTCANIISADAIIIKEVSYNYI